MVVLLVGVALVVVGKLSRGVEAVDLAHLAQARPWLLPVGMTLVGALWCYFGASWRGWCDLVVVSAG